MEQFDRDQLLAGVDAFDRAAGLAAFLAVMAALGGLVGRCFEVLKPKGERERTDMKAGLTPEEFVARRKPRSSTGSQSHRKP